MRKKILEKRLARLYKKKETLTSRALASEDANEVRSINEQLSDINEEIEETQEELNVIKEAEEACALLSDDNNDNKDSISTTAEDEVRTAMLSGSNVQARGGNPIASYLQNAPEDKRNENDIYSTNEYRNAFLQYVQTGVMQYERRDETAGMITTSDIGVIIPTTIMNEFIRTVKGVYGTLYNRVRKLNVPGGVEFPIEDLVPTVSWVGETEVAKEQATPEIKIKISFAYHICEARIAQSLLSVVVTRDALEKEIAKLLAEAFIKEFDRVIINGTGAGQPLGILNDKRIEKENKIAFNDADMADWTKWRKKLFAKIPLAYRGEGIFIMTANTWETYIMTLANENNDPVAVETFKIEEGVTICRFAGREVILVEPDIIKDYDTAVAGEAFAIYFKPSDYAINSNLKLGFKRYYDENNNKWVNKGLTIMDGKLLDVKGAFILTK